MNYWFGTRQQRNILLLHACELNSPEEDKSVDAIQGALQEGVCCLLSFIFSCEQAAL